MTLEEALAIVTAVLAPRSLTKLQTDVFRGAWNKESYLKISLELNHRDGYIKDVGAELWQLLSRALGLKVTKLNLPETVARYVQQQQLHDLPVLPHNHRTDWGEAPDTSHFCGRQPQLATLQQWVLHDRCRLVAIVGMGGIGKTMLVTQLAQHLAATNQFEVVLWRSLRQAPPLVDLLSELMQAFAPKQSLPLRLDAMMRQLLELLRYRRCLLILDNVESVLSGSELVGTYRPGYEEYGWLFQQLGQGRHQSSILMTSREIPAEVAIYQGARAPIRLLRLEGLSLKEGKAILATKGLIPAEQLQVEELIERYQGNPLALQIVATLLKDLLDGSIAAFLAQETLLFKDLRSLLAQQFNRLSPLEQQVMYRLAINREPVTAAKLQADLKSSVSRVALLDALVSLDRRSLIETIKPTSAKLSVSTTLNAVSYTQQSMVMEYVTERLNQASQDPEQAEIDRPRSRALEQAQAKDHVQDVQKQPVQPVLAELLEAQGSSEGLKQPLQLQKQQHYLPLQPRCFAGTIINLLCQLGADVRHWNFSLRIRQIDLRIIDLRQTITHTDLSRSVFTQSIGDILCVAFSSEPKSIATRHGNGEICVWRKENG